MLVRAANVEGVDFDSFQNEFDLDQDIAEGVLPRNNSTPSLMRSEPTILI